MDNFLEFLRFSDPTLRVVTGGTVFISVSAAIVGCFAFLRKRSLVGDAIAHAILPGIALAFILFQTKNPLYLLGGALLSGWLAMLSIDQIKIHSKLPTDTAIALVLSVFFGIGILLLTYIQHQGSGNQAGLDQFLFGKAASMTRQDLWTYCIVAALLLLAVVLLYKELMLYSFNPDFAQASGLPVKFLRFALNLITVTAIAIGIQSVGVVLMAALLITPAAAARSWTNRLNLMILVAALLGALSGMVGSYVSFSAPAMPTGPWIVMSLSVLAMLSLIVAPRRGLLARYVRQKQNREKIVNENVLKLFYQIGEDRKSLQPTVKKEELGARRDFRGPELEMALKRLLKNHLILRQGEAYKLSRQGLDEARRVVRLHRLWEMYLSRRLRLKADHIHPNAETMEHIITPEIEEQLLRELDYPKKDPHLSPIPYSHE